MSDSNQPHDSSNEVDPAKMWFRYARYPYLLSKIAFYGAIAYGVYLCLMTVDAVLFPVLVSLLIAYLLDPTIDWAEEKGVNRTVAILIFILVGVAGVALFALVLYPTFANSIATLFERLPQVGTLLEERFIPWVETRFGYQLPPTISGAVIEYRDQIQAQIPSVAKQATSWAGGLLSQTGAIVTSVLNLVMIPLFSFYFLRDFDKMRLSMVEFVPSHRRTLILDRITKMDTVVGAWFRGQVNVALILAVLYSVGLGGVFGAAGIGTTSGIAVGILTGLLNIVPYFGVLIGIILSVLLVLIDWTGPGPLIGVLAVFMVVQLLEGYVITPKIVGEAVGLSPVVVIIVLLLGGEILGLMGVLLAIPVAGVIKVMLPDIIARYQTSPFYTGEFRPGEDYEDVAPDGPPSPEPSPEPAPEPVRGDPAPESTSDSGPDEGADTAPGDDAPAVGADDSREEPSGDDESDDAEKPADASEPDGSDDVSGEEETPADT